MHQPYNAWADLLSKFHTSPDWIQALWLIAVPATVVGLAWCVADVLKAALMHRSAPRGPMLYGVFEDGEGRWLVYRGGEVRVVERAQVGGPEGA